MNISGSIEILPSQESKRIYNHQKITVMSERLASTEKESAQRNAQTQKIYKQENSSCVENKYIREISIDLKPKQITSPTIKKKIQYPSKGKSTMVSGAAKFKADKENINYINTSPIRINLIPEKKRFSNQKEDPLLLNHRYFTKKSSSFVSQVPEFASHHKLGSEIFYYPRTENPSFVESDINRSTSNLNCMKILRTTNDTDKENEPVNTKHEPKISPSVNHVKKSSITMLHNKKKSVESPFCHLKMPKNLNFFESKKRMNSQMQR